MSKKRAHWPDMKPPLDPGGTKSRDAIDATEQIRNKTQHYGSDIAEHKIEAYKSVRQNHSPNRSERFDRDVTYKREHRLQRRHAITARIQAEPRHAEKHGHPHGV
jgi:hypothetical protein